MDVELSSNIDEVGRWLDRLVDTFDFTRPGRDKGLGQDLVGVVAQGIADRCVPDAKAADGTPWKENEEKYAKRKGARYAAYQPGILTGQMLSLESLKGRATITPNVVTMTYGTNTTATRATTGSADDRDCKATDVEKADYFTGNNKQSVERPFYELDDAIAEAVLEEAQAALTAHLKGHH